MQSQRLFEIVFSLMEQSPRTAGDLAARLEVSERTIRRDIEALSTAGVPVYMTRGKGGGVHLLPGYVLEKSLVSAADQDEILAALRALQRIGATNDNTLPDRISSLFQRERQFQNTDWLDIDFSFWGAPPLYRQAFDLARHAIVERRVLRFAYRDAADRTSERSVEAVKLVFKERSWYLRAWCRKRADWRTFKLIRIVWESMQLSDETFAARELPQEMSETYTTSRDTILVLLFSPHDEARVREEFAPDAVERLADGRFRVTLSCEITERTLFYLLSFGGRLEVAEPAAVRSWLRAQAEAVARLYS